MHRASLPKLIENCQCQSRTRHLSPRRRNEIGRR